MLRSATTPLSAAYFSDNGTTAPSTAHNTARSYDTSGSAKGLFKESASALALRALKAISKSSVSALQLDEVPSEFLFGEHIDLHKWTMILKDSNLKELSEQRTSGKQYFLDASANRTLDMFKGFYVPLKVREGVITLNISNAKDITDFGLTMIARNSPALRELNISGCSNITDVGLREVGMNCNKLQCLNISSCPEIDGSGLVALAESCRLLLKLDISKCRKIENWSIKKVFFECRALEEVTVAHMNKIGDEEIRVLAQNCANLTALYAAECPYVSDTSIQIVAQNCLDLDLLDVSRTEMQYRISDVSMLALGQKSRSLRTLRVAGCENISDVGLNWLTDGCKVLEELDLGRCTKVTDAGLRSIGMHCHALTKLDISHAKMVTDVGISSLSTGCSNLRHVVFHGVFMLSDPRLSAPKKGVKLEAWQAVIGVAALAEHCPYVETLDLSGCFRLNIALHQYVAGFQHLTVLNLAGCNQSSPEAFSAVAKGCPLIVELNLSDCGKAANNKSVQAFGVGCKGLKILALCRCTHVSGGGIKAISSLRLLEKLDLTGCKTLTDSMLIYLTEVDKVPALRTLSLVDIPAVTDSLLAWLSIKTHNILLLALKGTGVSVKAIKSVRDRFPNSDMLQNANFYGFWPKLRVNDRILINKYHHFIDGATRIQGRIRKHRAVQRVNQIHLEWKRIAAQALLQKIVRGFLARARTRMMREYQRLRQHSAVVVTSIFRIAVALKKCERRRAYLRQIFKNQMAQKIQLCWRKHRDYNILLEKRRARAALGVRRQFGALKMQTAAYIFFARRRIRRIKALKRTREEVANRKATIIQRNYRGFVARRITTRFREIFANLAKNRLEAAIRIQRKVRSIRTVTIINAAIYVKLHRLESVIKIQSLLRGALARIHVAELRLERLEDIRLRAIVKIQTRLRMLRAYIELQRRIMARDRLRGDQYAASAKIVGQARIKLACIRYREKTREHRRKMKETAQRELDAICKIQARVRGIKGRKLFDAKLRDRKGKWKELFDEKAGKRFFYNKLSGEIRWRMPQDLLDLIPHPHCDNCHHVDATLECSVCNELFCGPCFDNVHSGGRRKEHTFRALYDYYNKRLDYGDGEFPCKWPTEVMQDEVQGWMLRVAPKRAPIRKYASGWEEYEEGPLLKPKKLGESTPLGNGGKLFYFNRDTFEATYDLPDEVLQEQQAEAAAALAAQQQQVATFAQSSGYYDAYGTWVNTYDAGSWAGAQAADGSMVPYDANTPYAASTDFEGSYYQPPNTADYDYNYGNSLQQVPSKAESYNSDFIPVHTMGGDGTYDANYDASYYQNYPPAEGYDQYGQPYPEYGQSQQQPYAAQRVTLGGYKSPQKQITNYEQPVYEENYYDYEPPPPADQNAQTYEEPVTTRPREQEQEQGYDYDQPDDVDDDDSANSSIESVEEF